MPRNTNQSRITLRDIGGYGCGKDCEYGWRGKLNREVFLE